MTETTGVPAEDGIYGGIPDTVYHSDKHSLSSSGARDLLASPAKFAWQRNQPPKNARHFDIGHYVHGKVLGVGSPVVVIDADDYRSKAAKEQRDQAYADGLVPILRKEVAELDAMAEAVLAHPTAAALFEEGVAELSMWWHDTETGVRCRARTDWLREYPDGRRPIIGDVKTTGTGASPSAFSATAGKGGLHIQEAWYREAARECGIHDDPWFIFINVEKDPPHLVSLTQLTPRAVELGAARMRAAIDLYANCLANDHWPDYGPDIHTVDLPNWVYYQEEM